MVAEKQIGYTPREAPRDISVVRSRIGSWGARQMRVAPENGETIMKRSVWIGAAILVLVAGLGVGSVVLEKKAAVQAASVQAPMFEVDPMLPNHWVIGMTIGVSVDAQDNVWIIHRGGSLEAKETYGNTNPPGADCCVTAPSVLEFDKAGNLLEHWGGPGKGYNWPNSNHGITVDYKGNVWIGGNGRTVDPKLQDTGASNVPEASHPGAYADNQILKFTQDGKFLMHIGHPLKSKGSNDTENLKGPAKMFIDPKTNELYVADGYGNKRVIVFDADTGQYKRHWGAYGHKPDDTDMGLYNPDAPIDQQFRNPVHCAQLADDGLLYVCDRVNDRIQVFKPDGTFIKEQIIEKRTLGDDLLFDEGAVRLEYLDAVVHTVAHVEQAIVRELGAVHRIAELLVDRRVQIVKAHVCVVRLVPVGAPMPLVLPRVGVEHDDAFVAIPIGDVQFICLRIDEHFRRTFQVLDVVAALALERMPDLHQEFSVLREL